MRLITSHGHREQYDVNLFRVDNSYGEFGVLKLVGQTRVCLACVAQWSVCSVSSSVYVHPRAHLSANQRTLSTAASSERGFNLSSLSSNAIGLSLRKLKRYG